MGIGQSLSCFGNAGPGSLIKIPGTMVDNWNVTFSKNFPSKGEGRALMFRLETYNLFNHTIQPREPLAAARLDQLEERPISADQRSIGPLHGSDESQANVDVVAADVLRAC
ncbi:MAG: hypothetical protein LAQ30_23240 [Acidobacteriia bacterium]|nr:hypothetical protein [Terriglobia bacterium]